MPQSALAFLVASLESFFRRSAPLTPGDRLVVGFSGGPDSTALLLGLTRLPQLPLRLLAVHMDHGRDPGSPARALAAARLAAALAVPCTVVRRPVALRRRPEDPAESPEAASRRERYALLQDVARQAGARYVATAHHRDDQAETVLLRLLFGSGIGGLAGIAAVADFPARRDGDPRLLRPLLAVPRATLAAALADAGLVAVDDPTNRDLAVPRNLLRHRVLPALAAGDPPGDPPGDPADLAERLARLAARAAGARRRIEDRLEAAGVLLAGPALDRRAYLALPAALQSFALAALHRRAGAPYPGTGAARAELARQLARAGAVGCDCGRGWRWEGRPAAAAGRAAGGGGARLTVRRVAPIPRPATAKARQGRGFTYTLRVSEAAASPIEILFDAAAVKSKVAEIGRRLAADLRDESEDPLFLAVLGGSVLFLADLVRAVERPVRFELMQVAYSEGEAGGGEPPATPAAAHARPVKNIHYPIPVEIAGRRVVVLRDIVSSGVIESYLVEQLRLHGARRVQLVALLDLANERKAELELDYFAFTTRRRGVLVGYGLKHQGRHGNLPYIGRLPEPD